MTVSCARQHFQIIMSLRRCPLFQFRLRPFDRVMYCSGVWSYIVGAVTTFTFLSIPLLTIWIGVRHAHSCGTASALVPLPARSAAAHDLVPWSGASVKRGPASCCAARGLQRLLPCMVAELCEGSGIMLRCHRLAGPFLTAPASACSQGLMLRM